MKLSIITINYNNREGLLRTINSVICQTWCDFEWIVIDGGSTDGSRELIEQYQSHFSYWCSEPDKGVYNAMNKGIAKAKGEWVNFMNSGDVLNETDTLEKVFSEKLWADVIYGDWIEVLDGGYRYKKSPVKATLDFFYSDNICHQALFVKSTILKEEGYDECFQIYADWAKWIMLMLKGTSFQYIPIVICKYDCGDGLSRRDIQKLRDELEKTRSLIPPNIRIVLDNNVYLRNILKDYKNCSLLRDIILLYEERPIYRRLIHLNRLFMMYLKKILDICKI